MIKLKTSVIKLVENAKKQINSFELKGYISNFFNGEFDIKNKKNEYYINV